MTPADAAMANEHISDQQKAAALWSFGKAWPHRFGQSGVRYHIRQCVAVLRAAKVQP